MLLLVACHSLVPASGAHSESFRGTPFGMLEMKLYSDGEIARADEAMERLYLKLLDALPAEQAEALRGEQREWLGKRTKDGCSANDDCLGKLYEDRVAALKARFDKLVPMVPPGSPLLDPLRPGVGREELILPNDFSLYAISASPDRPAVTRRIVANSPDRPVALLLSGPADSAWNIGWSRDTRIAAVAVVGGPGQAVAGLPGNVPVLKLATASAGPGKGSPDALSDAAGKYFGREAEERLTADAAVVVGLPLAREEKLFTSGDYPPALAIRNAGRQPPVPPATVQSGLPAPSALAPFAFPAASVSVGIRTSCGFGELALPGEFAVYAAGGDNAPEQPYRIDRSGLKARRFDIAVNSPKKPAVLILSTNAPSVWNIGWTPGTRILAVLAAGRFRQAVAGLPPGTPVLTSSDADGGPCAFNNLYGSGLAEGMTVPALNDLSTRLFGQPAYTTHRTDAGKAAVGAPLVPGEPLVTSPATPPDSFRDDWRPAVGPEGLKAALEGGVIRLAAPEDAEQWSGRRAKLFVADPVPPVRESYVILKGFRFPERLGRAAFFLPEGVPYPEGNPGNAALYDFTTMTCRGGGCPSGRGSSFCGMP
jgi:uncharacterized protein